MRAAPLVATLLAVASLGGCDFRASLAGQVAAAQGAQTGLGALPGASGSPAPSATPAPTAKREDVKPTPAAAGTPTAQPAGAHHGGGGPDELFKALDLDGNGKLDLREYTGFMLGMRGGTLLGVSGLPTEQGPAELFADQDVDKDGGLSAAELFGSSTPSGPGPGPGVTATSRPGNCATTYGVMDLDKDGTLTFAEFDRYHADLRRDLKVKEPEGGWGGNIPTAFKVLDRNEDGKVDLKKFCGGEIELSPNPQVPPLPKAATCAEDFKVLDMDGDGKLGRTDYVEAMFSRMDPGEAKPAADRIAMKVKLQEEFARLDKNGDGALDPKEFCPS